MSNTDVPFATVERVILVLVFISPLPLPLLLLLLLILLLLLLPPLIPPLLVLPGDRKVAPILFAVAADGSFLSFFSRYLLCRNGGYRGIGGIGYIEDIGERGDIGLYTLYTLYTLYSHPFIQHCVTVLHCNTVTL